MYKCDSTTTKVVDKKELYINLEDVNMLNKRSEFISKCRHLNK